MIKSQLLALLLPVCVIIGGCNAQTNPVSETSSDVSTSAETNAFTSENNTPAPSGKGYTVVDAASTGLPAAVVQALEKVALAPPPADTPAPKTATVQMITSKGNITVQLNGQAAPLQVKSFLYLSEKGFYNGTVFHRYADLTEGSGMPQKGRIIQGGDPLTKDASLKQYWGTGGPGYEVPRERNSLTHEAFVLAAARSQDPDSAGSQFYFTVDPTPFLDDGDGYTVFGKVLSGKDVVEKLREGDKLEKVEVEKPKESSKTN